MSKYCIVIPVYNHGKELLQTLLELSCYNLRCFVVNDGSDDETTYYLDEAKKIHDWIKIITLQNQNGEPLWQ